MENQRKPHEYNYKPGNVKGNSREDAEICIKIARQAMNEGDVVRAKKFAAKAERMYRTREGKDLVDVLNRKENGTTEEEGRHAVKKEQEDEVRRVKEARDVYDVLGVKKDYSPVDVTKAFRRLSLILHPDRNKAQGAKEAYMTIKLNNFLYETNVEIGKNYRCPIHFGVQPDCSFIMEETVTEAVMRLKSPKTTTKVSN